jgi:hypothetical protein
MYWRLYYQRLVQKSILVLKCLYLDVYRSRNALELIDIPGVGKTVSALKLTQAITNKNRKDARTTLNEARRALVKVVYSVCVSNTNRESVQHLY